MVVAAGVVVGFPLFTALALQHEDSAHGAVIVGLLPTATAVLGVLRNGERPSPAFWAACGVGAGAVTVFALVRGQGLPTGADVLTVLAVLAPPPATPKERAWQSPSARTRSSAGRCC